MRNFDDDDRAANIREGEELRDEAIARVLAGADEDWKATALICVELVAQSREFFTTDQVWAALAEFDADTHEPRAMGGIMTQAAKRGWVTKSTLPSIPSERPVCHRNPKQVWQSLLYQGADGS